MTTLQRKGGAVRKNGRIVSTIGFYEVEIKRTRLAGAKREGETSNYFSKTVRKSTLTQRGGFECYNSFRKNESDLETSHGVDDVSLATT